METMGEQLKFLVPENLKLVKQQQNGLVEELEHCETTIKNEMEQRRMLEKDREELEVKLKQEKASALSNAKAQEVEFQNVSKKLELETTSLEQQIKDVTLELENTKRQTEIFEREGQLLQWLMFEQHNKDDEQLPARVVGEPLKSNEEAKLLLSNIIEQVGKQRKYCSKLHELCTSVVMERDKTMEEVELLKIRLGEEYSVDDTVRVGDRMSSIESPSDIDMSDTERLKKRIRRGSSYENLTAKIGVLQMESRHKSKIIQVLEQEQDEEYSSVVRNDNLWGSNVHRSQDRLEYNRYQMYGYRDGENGQSASSDSAELGDDEGESVIDHGGDYGTEKEGAGN